MLPDLKIIQVTFEPDSLGKLYSYYTHIAVKEGDPVVVAVPTGLDKDIHYRVAYVTATEGLSQSELNRASKCIVSKVDVEEHERVMLQLKTVKELKLKLKQRKEQLDEAIIYAQLAKSDPEMQAMIETLNGIAPGSIPTLEAPKDAK